MINKRVENMAAALEGLESGATIMVSGFQGVGMPNALLDALLSTDVSNLTLIANGIGKPGTRVCQLIQKGRVRKVICSAARSKDPSPKGFSARLAAGEIELELVSQGTFAERMRAAGAGFPGYYSPVSVGTTLADGKEIRAFDGRDYVLEKALKADFALLRADTADRWGNLRFTGTQSNFGPVMCFAGTTTVVEVETFLGDSMIPAQDVHTPGIFVQRVIETEDMR